MKISVRLKALIKLGIGIGLILIFIRQLEWERFRETIASVNFPFLFLGMLLTFFNMFISAWRWHVLLRALHARIHFFKVVKLLLVASFFNTFLPGGFAGDVVRGLQSKGEGVSVEDAFSLVLTDRILGLIGLVLFALIGIFYKWDLIQGSGLSSYLLLTCFVMIVLTAGLYNRRFMQNFRFLMNLLGTWGKNLERFYRSFYQYRHKWKALAAAFVITIMNHLIMFASIYCLAWSLNASLPFSYFVLFLPLIGILSMVPVTIGGLGLREFGFITLFPLAGMTKTQALGTSLFFFLVMVAVALIGALIYLGETAVAITTKQPA